MRQDEGDLLTERELAKLEKRIRQEYGAAQKELADTITQYFADFAVRDEQMKKLIGTEQNGKTWTEEDYRQWRLAQIGRGERFQALQRRIAERYTNARETAESYVNDATPGIYRLNRNYAAYTIEQVAGNVGFDFLDEQTVRRLLVEQPELMPHYPEKRAIKRGIDLAYGQKQIAASVTSGILQGKSLKAMADDLQERIPEMSRNSALRAARTAVTGAQNAGRTDSYAAAEKMGVKTKRKWVATLDNRTRHEHGELDGQVVAVDEPFEVGGYSLMFPGDPAGPPHLIYNCRCRIKPVVEGHEQGDQRRARDPETGRNVLIENMSYAEWAGWKEKAQVQNAMDTPKNKYGEEIAFDFVGASDEARKQIKSDISYLSDIYDTGLREVQYVKKSFMGGEAGNVDVTGSIMTLHRASITKHEFFHTLDMSSRSKKSFGGQLETNNEFWKEAKKLFSKYKKEAVHDIGMRISDYSTTNVDEFMSEAFSVYYGGKPADSFGVGIESPYVTEAVSIIDKYFKRKKK